MKKIKKYIIQASFNGWTKQTQPAFGSRDLNEVLSRLLSDENIDQIIIHKEGFATDEDIKAYSL